MLRWMIASAALCSAAAAQIKLVDEPMPAFDGIDQNVQPMPGVPADPDIAAGEHFIFQVVNGVISWWKRDDMVVTDSMALCPFLGLIDQPVSFGTDPRVIFDETEDRFVASAYGLVPGKFGRQIVVSVSPNERTMLAGDPLDNWTTISLPGFFQQTGDFTSPCATGDGVIGGISADQPLLGATDDCWIISAFLAPLIVDSPADYVIYAIDKTTLDVAGPMFASQIFRDEQGQPLGCVSGTRGLGLPRPIKGRGAPTALFVGTTPNQAIPGAETFTSVTLFAITDPFATRTSKTTRIELSELPDEPPCAPTIDSPAQAPLHALDARVQSAAWHDDGAGGSLWITLCTNVPVDLDVTEGTEQPRAAIKWYRIALNGWPEIDAQPAIESSGTILAPSATSNQPPTHFFFPAGIVNDQGDFAVVHARSSASETASIRAWGRASNATVLAPLVAKVSPVGATPNELYLGTCARWGDYFDVELDPLDDTFWGTGMYMKSASPKTWGTWIFHFEIVEP